MSSQKPPKVGTLVVDELDPRNGKKTGRKIHVQNLSDVVRVIIFGLRGESRADLARRIGIAQQTLDDFLAGSGHISMRNLSVILYHLGTNAAKFFMEYPPYRHPSVEADDLIYDRLRFLLRDPRDAHKMAKILEDLSARGLLGPTLDMWLAQFDIEPIEPDSKVRKLRPN